MPFEISSETKLQRVKLTGRVGLGDFEELATAVEQWEQQSPVMPDRIVDLTGVTELNLDYASMLKLATRRRKLQFPNPFKSAIIARELHHVGFARMFQILQDHPQVNIQIFPDEPLARQWLGGEGVRA
jgi:hypothetical protein